jgi:HPt (histidine-containing phosphotransfer) domain-containing protein
MLTFDTEFELSQQKQAEYRQEVASNRLAEMLARYGTEQSENKNTVRAALGRQLVKLGQRLQ